MYGYGYQYSNVLIGGGLPTPPLDVYTGAAAAYSLRLLRTAYVGSAIRVRRSSDNAEQDIGFVSGVLDTASLLTFCGAGNGFVTTWYDQSGNARNLTMITATSQPQIVSSGSVIIQSGLPSIKFDGTNDYLTVNYPNTVMTTLFSTFGVFAWDGAGGGTDGRKFLFETKSSTSDIYNPSITIDSGSSPSTLTGYSGGVVGFSSNQTTSTIVTNVRRLITFIRQTTNNLIYLNSSLEGTLTNGTFSTFTNLTGLNVGTYRDANNRWFSGNISELLFYPTDETSNRALIDDNINSYYGIY